MAVWALGINHTTAPLDLRGRLAVASEQIVPTLLGLRNAKDWQRSEQDGGVFYQDGEGQRWQKLDIKQLLQQPEFIQIGV